MAFFSKLMRSEDVKDEESPSTSEQQAVQSDSSGTSTQPGKDPSQEGAVTSPLAATSEAPASGHSTHGNGDSAAAATTPPETLSEAKAGGAAPVSAGGQESAIPSPDKVAPPPSRPGSDNKGDRRVADRIKPFVNTILCSQRLTEMLPNISEDLKELFDCDHATLYSVDRVHRQIYSRNIKVSDGKDIRLEINKKSLAGFVAATGKTLNITDAYSKAELSKFHPELVHDPAWDKVVKSKTLSTLIVPLPQGKRLMGVLQLVNKKGGGFNETDVRTARELAGTLGHGMVRLDTESMEEKIRAAAQAIQSPTLIDDILKKLEKPLLQIFDASVITVYSVAPQMREIFSRMKSGDGVDEIRVPISPKSIAGCVAYLKKPANIVDVYDEDELARFHPDVFFDSSWDTKTGLATKTMLALPMLHGDEVLGVLQIINKNLGNPFTDFDEKNGRILADGLGAAFASQKNFFQNNPTRFSYLVENGFILQDDLDRAIATAGKKRVRVESVLLNEHRMKRKDIGKSLEVYYNVPYTGFNDSITLPKQIFAGLNKNYLTRNNWVPLQNNHQSAVILVDDPSDQDKIRNIRMIFPKKEIEFHVSLKEDIDDFLNKGLDSDDAPAQESSAEDMTNLLTALEDEQSLVSPEMQASVDEDVNAITETDSTIVRLVNKVLTDAFDMGVSDVHIEPGVGKKDMRVRFRKDGACQIYQHIPYMYKQAIISRLKIMAKLDIAERRMPQDGKIKMRYGKREIEYRMATCPTVGGNEDAVLRILADSKPIPLDQMQFSEKNLLLITEKIQKPYGLILVVGPTGSGKTTTLHSCLGFINTADRKIWTAEDPVEITQEGLRQVQMLNKIGLNFARAMRSFLRGDPDVIMVGEMRDTETAAIGLEASLTGHLVLSTLHTNSAPETIVRLLDMGMNPLNFADALLLIVAQRLVRTLCKECKTDYNPSRDEFNILVREYGEESFEKNLGIKYGKSLMLKKATGCAKCNNTGYSGRMGLHELLSGTKDIKRKIMDKSIVEELRNQAIADGMTTLKQDGIEKIFKGHCDLKQVLSVCVT
jgi:type II secretory ATPase GspE/PulE/Tfp pilus assembly ATPase PilB-like protein/GAF domain-containing protein